MGAASLRVALGFSAAAAWAGAAGAAPPLPAHGRFVSHAYTLTFQAPPGLTYCRLPDDWTGSDHGTVLFLTPPRDCDGTGYPSISRGFDPADTPRIEVEYERWDPEIEHHAHACLPAGRIALLGRLRTLCRGADGVMAVLSATGLYTADSPTQAIVTLVTSPARIARDLPVLRRLAATIQSCAVPWQDQAGHRRTSGSGRPCPDDGGFY